VVPSNTVLDRDPGPPTEWRDLGSESLVKICIAILGQTVTGTGIVTTDSL